MKGIAIACIVLIGTLGWNPDSCEAFKLEKDPIQLTQTEARKAEPQGEQKKIKEGPASPSFRMDSFDDFMSEGGPLKKTVRVSSEKRKVSGVKKLKRKIK